ncbi:TetR family transcriptional regulator [Actinoplanes philippinensis]|uniref:DNA-binding transcriptional regulator, AcrR family n=1 Tax=Actinoplanes philippinensis TaxID=35752 RepID=A0A1I2G3Z1_9ACTN|nr:TetR/AcrR family transcriptional regulator [Actinoplanes philippinensis]GIE76563.1 TetR family transcriptional regulator [Actinoplanes philippinensis]SFF11843.1 DNA-binding transcriptional regulator, AcrR family [Actinoplanes philippinensis]
MKARPYHHGDLRAALLTLAEDTLRARGPAELSLRELAREAGVSPAAPSRHFKTKQALLDALAIEGFQRLTSAMDASLDRVGESFGARLTAVARTYLGFAAANGALLELMYGRKHDPDASTELITAMHRLKDLATDLIADGQRRGEVRPGPLDLMSLPLFVALQGLTQLATSGGFPADQIEAGVDETIAFILRGYAPS